MRRVFWIILAGLLVRLAIFPLLNLPADYASGDSADYLSGQSSIRAPLYSLVVAELGRAIFAAQSLITIATGVGAYLVLRADNEGPAFAAGLLIAAMPFPVFMEARVLSEILYGALVLGAFLLLYRADNLAAGLLAGAILGVAILTRDTLMLLPLFVLPFRFKQGLAVVAAAYLMALPWYLTTPSEGRSGFALWVGTWERSPDWQGETIAFPDHAFRSQAERAQLERAFAEKRDAPFRRAAIDRLSSDPAWVAGNWIVRYPRLWLGTRSELNTFRIDGTPLLFVKAGLWGLNLILITLGIWGAWLARRTPLILLAIPVAYVGLAYIPFHNTEPRYSLMALPFLCIFAAQAPIGSLRRLWQWLFPQHKPGRCRICGEPSDGEHYECIAEWSMR